MTAGLTLSLRMVSVVLIFWRIGLMNRRLPGHRLSTQFLTKAEIVMETLRQLWRMPQKPSTMIFLDKLQPLAIAILDFPMHPAMVTTSRLATMMVMAFLTWWFENLPVRTQSGRMMGTEPLLTLRST